MFACLFLSRVKYVYPRRCHIRFIEFFFYMMQLSQAYQKLYTYTDIMLTSLSIQHVVLEETTKAMKSKKNSTKFLIIFFEKPAPRLSL